MTYAGKGGNRAGVSLANGSDTVSLGEARRSAFLVGYDAAPVDFDGFADALTAIREMRRDGIVTEYAVGGAMAISFWAEPAATFDLDVFVLYESAGPILSLAPIYEWAKARGYESRAEHIVISGVPVQVMPVHSELAAEAVRNAAELDYDGIPVRVITPEYLVALYLEPSARTRTRLVRIAGLLDSGVVDRALLDSVLKAYNLELPNQ